jgi:hypothetical protein
MRLLPAALLTLALAGPAMAYQHAPSAEVYQLQPCAIIPLPDRWYLMKYCRVTVDPGETEMLRLMLDRCPGGVDSPAELYFAALDAGEAYYDKLWWHPVAYNGYLPDVYATITNASAAPMRFAIKLSLRCKG